MFLCLYVCVYGAVCVYECVHSAICVWTVQLVYVVRKLQSLRLKALAGLRNVDEIFFVKTNFRNDINLSGYITDNYSNSTVPSQQTPVYIPQLYSTPSTSGTMEKSWGKAPARISM